ncbi:Conserved_hypothetical protein [Hexamita inflata]|uniref:Uncharacterized protein n=1 Tax=Hexamita inflata TaxID=28002 RepID=A0AA86TV13_9EUKA|nr:Conserved hypothetical protein [Hexamita inflata]
MQPNHEIESQEDLLKHFVSSQKLEILNLEQMENLLTLNVPPEVWEDASNRNLLSFSQELVQGTEEFTFYCRDIEYIYLLSFITNLTELDLSENKISDISAISKLKNLNKLYLSGNYIEDISALQSLPDLTHLQLQQTRIISYTLVLPNLVDLQLGNNKLQDISGLQHSPKLERLNLISTKTTDIQYILQQIEKIIQNDGVRLALKYSITCFIIVFKYISPTLFCTLIYYHINEYNLRISVYELNMIQVKMFINVSWHYRQSLCTILVRDCFDCILNCTLVILENQYIKIILDHLILDHVRDQCCNGRLCSFNKTLA